jgi:hypothetical protein
LVGKYYPKYREARKMLKEWFYEKDIIIYIFIISIPTFC